MPQLRGRESRDISLSTELHPHRPRNRVSNRQRPLSFARVYQYPARAVPNKLGQAIDVDPARTAACAEAGRPWATVDRRLAGRSVNVTRQVSLGGDVASAVGRGGHGQTGGLPPQSAEAGQAEGYGKSLMFPEKVRVRHR